MSLKAYSRPGPPLGSRGDPQWEAGAHGGRRQNDLRSADFPEGAGGAAQRPGASPPATTRLRHGEDELNKCIQCRVDTIFERFRHPKVTENIIRDRELRAEAFWENKKFAPQIRTGSAFGPPWFPAGPPARSNHHLGVMIALRHAL